MFRLGCAALVLCFAPSAFASRPDLSAFEGNYTGTVHVASADPRFAGSGPAKIRFGASATGVYGDVFIRATVTTNSGAVRKMSVEYNFRSNRRIFVYSFSSGLLTFGDPSVHPNVVHGVFTTAFLHKFSFMASGETAVTTSENPFPPNSFFQTNTSFRVVQQTDTKRARLLFTNAYTLTGYDPVVITIDVKADQRH